MLLPQFPAVAVLLILVGPVVVAHDRAPMLGHLASGVKLPIQFPDTLTLTKGQQAELEFTYNDLLEHDLLLELNTSRNILKLDPDRVVLRRGAVPRAAALNVTGLELSSRTYIDVVNCSLINNRTRMADCPFNPNDVFVLVTVVKSAVISALVLITGWIYFFAWSISFYPQIVLNFQRKSVIGLNFDFLLLNVIGFACYTVYNVLLYFDPYVQQIYIEKHGPRSTNPVLINDVVFASHALVACIITAVQCFIYERGAQRISYVCRGWASLLLCFSFVSLLLAIVHVLNWLDFINYLSYAKMAVTLSKYFPQAILNFRRKSTVGWSIGNVLLDFSGGFMDICQMCLQATNANDWSAFTGNIVKFGLGLVSMLFDILFIIQHYVLYREKEDNVYNPVQSTPESPPFPVAASPLQQHLSDDDDAAPIVSP